MAPEDTQNDLKQDDILKDIQDRMGYFLLQFIDESDRAAVILCAAKMDYLLYNTIQARLLPIPSSNDPLLDFERALGTFSTRIDAAYRLGLIDAPLSRVLHIYRKIRNEFAHELSGSTLNDGSHKDRIRELIHPIKKVKKYDQIKSSFKKISPTQDDVHLDFYIATCMIVGKLEGLCEFVKPVDSENIINYVL